MAASDHVPPRILIADDQTNVIEALRLLLKSEGYITEAAKSPAAALKAAEAHDYALAFIDLNYARDTTRAQEGLDLLAKLQALDATLPGGSSSATPSPPTVASNRRTNCSAEKTAPTFIA